MSIEEIIGNLEKLGSAEEKDDGYVVAGLYGSDIIETAKAAAALLRTHPDAQPNEPLTLEELRGLDGEPVWVQSPGIPEYGCWRIVAGVDTENGERTLYCNGDYTCRDYGKVWLAYRRPPKED